MLIKQDIATITQALAAPVVTQRGHAIEDIPGQGLGTLGVNSQEIEFDHVGEINGAHWKSFFPCVGMSTRYYGQSIYSTLATDDIEANSADVACVTMRMVPCFKQRGRVYIQTRNDHQRFACVPVCRKIGILGVVETPLEGARVKF